MSFGDRKDGKKVRNLHGMQYLLIDFKPNRVDSSVYMNVDIDVTEFVNYMNKLREKDKSITFFHGLVYVMGKAVYSKPYMNRFIADRKMYTHNDVVFGCSIKEEFEDDSLECLLSIKVNPNDTLKDLAKQTHDKVAKIRAKQASGIDDSADFIGKIPQFLRVPLVGILKWLDKKGLLPNSLCKGNLYYTTAILSNLGTFKTNGIYHNLTNFGTSSSLITFGEIKKNDHGRYMMNFGATIDERIADGFYFCTTLKLIEYIFAHPELMEEEASKKVEIPTQKNIHAKIKNNDNDDEKVKDNK